MKRSLARRLPVLKKFVRELDALEKKYAKLKKQRDNLKLDLAETKTHLEAFQQAEAEGFARRHLQECPLPVPPDSLRLRVHGAREEATFLFVGDAIASRIKEILVEEGRSFEAPARILDFGCGCGRTLRFFGDRIENRELFANDIDEEAISWCKNNLPVSRASLVTDTNPRSNMRAKPSTWSLRSRSSPIYRKAWSRPGLQNCSA